MIYIISIGNNSEETTIKDDTTENEVYLKQFVDDRLLAIQKEDQSSDTPIQEPTIQQNSMENKVNKKDEKTKEELKPVELVAEIPEVKLPPVPEPSIQAPVRIEQPLLNATYRVYIGYYHTYDQVKLAKEIVSETDSTLTPVIKEISGGYTLQAGVFKSKEAAVSLTNTLLKEHLPARMIAE